MKRTLFFLSIAFLPVFSSCQHKTATTTKPGDTTVAAMQREVFYIFTDTFYSKMVMGTDSVIDSFHEVINDTEKIVFDTSGKFLVFRNQTFNLYNTSPGDTIYDGAGPGTDANLLYVTPDTITVENISHLGHVYSWSSSLHGHKIH